MSYNHSYATMSIQSIHHCWVVNDNPHHQTTNTTSSYRRNRDTLSTVSVCVCAWLQMKLFGIFLFPFSGKRYSLNEVMNLQTHAINQKKNFENICRVLSCFVLSVENPAINVRIFKLKKKYVSKCKPTWTLYLSVHHFSLRVSGRIVFPSVQNINKKVEEAQKRTTKLSSFCKEWIQFAQKKTLQQRDTHIQTYNIVLVWEQNVCHTLTHVYDYVFEFEPCIMKGRRKDTHTIFLCGNFRLNPLPQCTFMNFRLSLLQSFPLPRPLSPLSNDMK